MIPVILWEIWQRNTLPLARLLPKLMPYAASWAASGLLVYMAYLGIKFGHPLAFASGQAAWHDGTLLDRPVSAATLAPDPAYKIEYGRLVRCVFPEALTIWSFLRLRFLRFTIYGASAFSCSPLSLTGHHRFDEPLRAGVLAWFVSKLGPSVQGTSVARQRGTDHAGIFAALLLLDSALFSQWYWAG